MSADVDARATTEGVFGPPIHTYPRAQALADGVLVDAGPLAQEAGFRWPVALTQAAHAEAVAWNPEHEAGQDETGRLCEPPRLSWRLSTHGG